MLGGLAIINLRNSAQHCRDPTDLKILTRGPKAAQTFAVLDNHVQ